MPATGANEGEEFKKAKQIRTPKGREGATRCDYIKHPSNKPEPVEMYLTASPSIICIARDTFPID